MNVHPTAILVHSGRLVDLAFPNPDVVRLDDIAHALARINRFTGHGDSLFSVAQHSAIASFLAPLECAAWALLHDASEAYLGDTSSPCKAFIRAHTPVLDRLQSAWDSAISEHFNVPRCNAKQWDNEATLLEVNSNGPHGLAMQEWERLLIAQLPPTPIAPRSLAVPWSCGDAVHLFLVRAKQLGITDGSAIQ